MSFAVANSTFLASLTSPAATGISLVAEGTAPVGVAAGEEFCDATATGAGSCSWNSFQRITNINKVARIAAINRFFCQSILMTAISSV